MKDFVKRVSQKIPKLSSEQLEQVIEALNAENDTLDAIMESLSTGLVIVDGSWHVQQTNKAAERLLPFAARPSEAKVLWKLINDNGISAFLQDCARGQKTNVREEFSLNRDDKIIFVTLSVLPLVQRLRDSDSDRINTRIVGSIIAVDDNTEKRQQDILLHRMESLASLTNLAASVAHEIKNPLGAISIHIQLLQKAVKKSREGNGKLPDEKFLEHYLDVVTEEIENLNSIVLDFLFAVRPVQASLALYEADALVKKTVDFFQPEFESRCMHVVTRLGGQNARLLLDEKLFRDVLLNLAQNALAAIEQRRGTAVVEDGFVGQLMVESTVKRDTYCLTFADNGCGMDGQTASRIFEPYYTTKANGTGLGLTMAYKIIKELRGDIRVRSSIGQGTVFTITIPVPQKQTMLLTGGCADEVCP